ncbi:hypothetical protein IEO21_00010 [Rhodonia placenta]|uniref:Nuclear protein DGCR14 n=1 Tax=Rhodonia placenta TaxID=104341 RepID=A0A8H7U8E3_9APHY|nr:hypothetical protein IEO21_00010 [Postia placenta]
MSTPTASSSSQLTRSLNRQVVLEEDEYTEALSHIIARDFFPSLVHLDATNGYLDALRTNDPALIQASVRRIEELTTPVTRRDRPWETPAQTPYRAGPLDTPIHTPRGEPPVKRTRYETDMSLDHFQAKYTSEDNSSFTQILDDDNRKRREKWAWAWDAQKRVEEQRGKMLEGRERLLIEAPTATGVKEKFRIEQPTPAGLLTDGSVSSHGAMQVEQPSGPGDEEHNEQGKEIVLKLVTWGTLTGTPRVLSQSDDPMESSSMATPNTPFRIAEPSPRERLSHRLSTNASKSLRAKAGLLGISGISRTPVGGSATKGSMAPPSWTPRRAEGGLTPAAKRLLDRSTMGTAAARRAEAMGRIAGWEGNAKPKDKDLNRVRWTPTPSPVTRR